MDRIPKTPKAYKNQDFLNSRNARPIRIQSEYFEPFHRFKQFDIKSTIVFFGSARISPMVDAQAKLSKAQNIYTKSNNSENKDQCLS